MWSSGTHSSIVDWYWWEVLTNSNASVNRPIASESVIINCLVPNALISFQNTSPTPSLDNQRQSSMRIITSYKSSHHTVVLIHLIIFYRFSQIIQRQRESTIVAAQVGRWIRCCFADIMDALHDLKLEEKSCHRERDWWENTYVSEKERKIGIWREGRR